MRNKTFLRGNAVADVRMLGESGNVGILRIAVDTGTKENKGSIFLNVKLFERSLRDVSYYNIGKGDTVFVEGRLSDDSYEAKDGTKIKSFEVIADSVVKVARPEKAGPSF